MKKYLLATVVLCALLVFGSPVWAIPWSTVGNLDHFEASAFFASSGDQTEIDWVNSELGTSFTTDDLIKDNDFADNPWEPVNGVTGIYATDLQDEPAWFFIKIGTGGLPDGTHTHWLYNNLTELGYAVVDFSIMPSSMNVGRISHTGQGPGTVVPEPATMLLLGSGLIGLGVLGRKKLFKRG